jgi:hypothetical protein
VWCVARDFTLAEGLGDTLPFQAFLEFDHRKTASRISPRHALATFQVIDVMDVRNRDEEGE